MRKVLVLVGLASLFSTLTGMAQEWTAEQKEVWKNVQAYSNLAAEGNVEGFIQYFHKDFSGWAVGNPVPDNREQRVQAIRHFMPKFKTLWSQVKPLAIKIHGNVAIVHYYYTDETKQGDKDPQMEQGRWTDILIKQGNKWVMIADHGGPSPDDDDD